MTMDHDAIMDAIDKATAPNKMTKAQALDFLEELADSVDSRCECLREEIKNEEVG